MTTPYYYYFVTVILQTYITPVFYFMFYFYFYSLLSTLDTAGTVDCKLLSYRVIDTKISQS